MFEYKRKYKYNLEAKEFIKDLALFDVKSFEQWVDKLVLQIGQQNVIQYLEEKRRWNTKCKLIDKQLKCDFSAQAKSIIKQMKYFDANECKIWFSNSIVMSKNDILNYLSQVR